MKTINKIMAVLLGTVLLFSSTIRVGATDGSMSHKDETAYLFLNPDGTLNDQVVSVWLQNSDGLKDVEDVSNLKDIQNIKSNLKPDINGTTVTWDTEDTDVYYKGTGTGTPPLDIKISYYLDDEEITAEDLLGKSGEVKINVSLTNNVKKMQMINGESRDVYMPLFAALIFNLPTAHFSNIQVPNAIVLTEGTNQIVTMLAVPGLTESFDGLLDKELENIKDRLSGDFTISATANNFVFPMMMGGAATKFSGLGEISGLTDTTEFMGGMNTLFDAINLLGESTTTLSDMLHFVQENKGELNDEVVTAADGIVQLSSGIEQLSSAAELLKTKVTDELIPGIDEAEKTKSELSTQLAEVEQLFSELNIPEIADIQGELTELINDACDESSDATIKALTGKTYSRLTAAEKLKVIEARTKVKLDTSVKILNFMSSLNATKLVSLITKLEDLRTSASSMLGGMDTLVMSLYNPNDDLSNPTSLATAILAFSNGIEQLDTGFNDFSNNLTKNIGSELDAQELSTALAVKDAMSQMVTEYTSYSGSPQNAETNLRFVIKVNEPEKEVPTVEDVAENSQVKLSFWKRIVQWVNNIFS